MIFNIFKKKRNFNIPAEFNDKIYDGAFEYRGFLIMGDFIGQKLKATFMYDRAHSFEIPVLTGSDHMPIKPDGLILFKIKYKIDGWYKDLIEKRV